MPTGGLVGGVTDPEGGMYVETTHVIAKGVPGGSDVYTPADPGPHTYGETTTAVAKGVPGSSDTVEFPSASITEVTNVVATGYPASRALGGPFVYIDTTEVVAKGLLDGRDRQILDETTNLIAAKGFVGSSDIFFEADLGSIYYEYTEAIGQGRESTGDLLLVTGQSAAIAKGKAATGDLGIYTVQSGVIADGKPGSIDSRSYTESTLAKAKGQAGSLDPMRLMERAGVIGTGRAGGSDLLSAIIVSNLIVSGRPGSLDPMVLTESSKAFAKGVEAGADLLQAVDTPLAKGAGKPGSQGAWLLSERSIAIGKGQPGLSTVRVASDATVAVASGSVRVTDVAVFIERTSVVAAGRPSNQPNSLDPNGLIPALRRHCAALFAGVASMPEGLPDAEMFEGLGLPLLCIIAGHPSRRELAVRDNGMTVPVDFVYVQEQAAGIDNAQAMRAAMNVLELALITDHQQFAFTDVPSAFETHAVATPMERVTDYQRHFSQNGQKVVVAVLSMEFGTLSGI